MPDQDAAAHLSKRLLIDGKLREPTIADVGAPCQ